MSSINYINILFTRFRSFLQRNKIFFEVILASLLSFMAIFVSIKTNSIAEHQTKIMEYENTPQLEIRKHQEFNQELNTYNDIWLIFNRNSKVSNFDIEENYSFIRFESRSAKNDSILIPIAQYVNTKGMLTGESEGLIYQFDNSHNSVYEFTLRNELINIGYLEIESYIKSTYKDVMQQKEEKYYKIAPDIKEIDKEEWNKIKEEFLTNLDDRIYIDNIKSEDLRKTFEKY